MTYTQIINTFQKLKDNNTLHHAYIMQGSEALGSLILMQSIARLICDQALVLDNHEQVILVRSEKNKKTGKTKKFIDVDQIRELRGRLALTQDPDQFRVVVIQHADRMNQSASNALLKTLEEPRGKTIIFLLVDDAEQLLPTLRSRSHQMTLNYVEEDIIETALKKTAIHATLQAEILRYAEGHFGLALAWAEDEESFDVYKTNVTDFVALFGISLAEKMKAIEPLFGDKTDANATKRALIVRLDLWIRILRSYMHKNETYRLPSVRLSTDCTLFVRAIDQAEETKQALRYNAHPKLVLERFLMALSALESV